MQNQLPDRKFVNVINPLQGTVDALYRVLRESGALGVFLEKGNKAHSHYRIVASIAQRNGDAPTSAENVMRRAVRVGQNFLHPLSGSHVESPQGGKAQL